MDRDVINRKLESLRRCIARIESKRPIRPDVLRVNSDLAAQAREGNYTADHEDWFVGWLAELRLGEQASSSSASQRLAQYREAGVGLPIVTPRVRDGGGTAAVIEAIRACAPA